MRHLVTRDEIYGGFQVIERSDSTRELVTALPSPDRRTVVLARPIDSAVVIGSMQAVSEEQWMRCENAGFSIHRRRSGGGAVVVDPEIIIWIDFYLPAADPLFDLDVRRGSFWVGELWAQSIKDLGYVNGTVDVCVVHRGPLVETDWSRHCCFAGVGPGEVLAGDRKVMGLSQRRERAGAWFYTLAYRSFDAERDAYLLAPSLIDASAMAIELAHRVGKLDRSRAEVEEAVLHALSHFDR